MEICIIGGSFYGIASAKTSIDHGLVPFILNKDPEFGGIWNGYSDQIGIWDSLCTNSSKFNTSFADYPWDEETQDFPSGPEVLDYLSKYITKHDLWQYFHNNCKVTEVSRHDESYLVKWLEAEKEKEKVFKYVLVCTGRNSAEHFPFENRELFNGTIIEASKYREPSIFTGKKVVCIGRSFSGSEIAFEATKYASKVIQISRSPRFVTELYNQGGPWDLICLNSKLVRSDAFVLKPSIETIRNVNYMTLRIFGNPGYYLEDWRLNDDESFDKENSVVIIRNGYLGAVKDKKIEIISKEVKGFYSDGIVFSDGTQLEADIVVSAAGYITKYDFLSDEIKQIIKYDDKDNLLSTILYRRFFHPSLPGLVFVGNYSNSMAGRWDLNAEIALRYVLNKLELTQEEIWEGLNQEEEIRNRPVRTNFPYSQIFLMKELLRILGIQLDYERIANELEFGNGPIIPQFIYLDRPDQLDLSRKVIAEIKRKFPNNSHFCS